MQGFFLFQNVALKLGLQVKNCSSLWKDSALLELNVAILHSFQVGLHFCN